MRTTAPEPRSVLEMSVSGCGVAESAQLASTSKPRHVATALMRRSTNRYQADVRVPSDRSFAATGNTA